MFSVPFPNSQESLLLSSHSPLTSALHCEGLTPVIWRYDNPTVDHVNELVGFECGVIRALCTHIRTVAGKALLGNTSTTIHRLAYATA